MSHFIRVTLARTKDTNHKGPPCAHRGHTQQLNVTKIPLAPTEVTHAQLHKDPCPWGGFQSLSGVVVSSAGLPPHPYTYIGQHAVRLPQPSGSTQSTSSAGNLIHLGNHLFSPKKRITRCLRQHGVSTMSAMASAAPSRQPFSMRLAFCMSALLEYNT